MAIRREFLDWNQPFLSQAAAWLMHSAQSVGTVAPNVCDLRACTCVVTGARAGRLLLGRLIHECDARGQFLLPPHVLTPGAMLSSLTESQPLAAPQEVVLAWAAALRTVDDALLAPLLPHRPEDDDELAWQNLAETLADLHAELAGYSVTFQRVADVAAGMELDAESTRWLALKEVHRQYLSILHRHGLVDPHEARDAALTARAHQNAQGPDEMAMALQHNPLGEGQHVVLLAVPELNGVQRALLDRLGSSVTALLHAPQNMSDRFDGYGCVKPEAWMDVAIDLDDGQCHLADQPGDQAETAIHRLATVGDSCTAADVVIGVGDETLVPFLKRAAEGSGLFAHWAGGDSLRTSAPLRLLASVADWLDEPRFAHFTALLRHPDVDRWLRATISEPATTEWLSLLDDYFADHLHERFTGEWLGTQDMRERLKCVYDAIQQWLRPLSISPRHPGVTQPLASWCAPVLQVLATIYDPATVEVDQDATQFLLAFRDALALLPRVIDALQPHVGAAVAVRMLLKHAGAQTIAEERREGQIDLLGWLELHLDPAPHLIITGVNDGSIPHTLSTGPFLPDALRGALGLPNHAQRYARDAYLMESIRHSRASLTLISGRVSADGDPLTPSRLLLACDGDQLVQRVLRLCDDTAESTPSGAGASTFGNTGESLQTSFVVPKLPPLTPPAHMSATQFRAYLECPYRYALTYLLRLEGYSEAAVEMDPMNFGSLAHDVLCEFGKSPEISTSTNAHEIASFLTAALARKAIRKFGPSPMPAVRVQLARMEQRLAAFASAHISHLAEGWRIQQCEYAFDGSIALDIPGQESMPLKAKIDRIDFNTRTGQWLILDYKTSEKGESPHKAHHGTAGIGDELEWKDLQLPLYHYLAARSALNITGPIKLGYIVLPGKGEQIEPLLAEWTHEHLESAWECARDVVRKIRNAEFPLNADHHSAFDPFARICQTTVFTGIEVEADNEEESS